MRRTRCDERPIPGYSCHNNDPRRVIPAMLGAQYEEGARLDSAIRENLARLGYRVGKEDAP